MDSYWSKQLISKPLFGDLLWSKPENTRLAGKLLIIGGNQHGFSTPVSAYSNSLKAGAGVVNVILPDSTRKLVGHIFSEVVFSSSTPSGGFGRQSLAEFIEQSEWSDAVFLAGEFGNNSETVILLESFIDKHKGLIIMANDAVGLATSFKNKILDRGDTIIVTGVGKLQKISESLRLPSPIKYSISLVNMVESLHELTLQKNITLVIEKDGTIFVAHKGMVSTTQYSNLPEDWQTRLGAHASVWSIQNKEKLFEALSCSVISAQE